MRRWLVALLVSGALGSVLAQDTRSAVFTVTHRDPGEPSLIEVQVTPPLGGRELAFELERGRPRGGEGTWLRRRLHPVSDGRYALDYRFPQEGPWRFFVHVGSGLSGWTASAQSEIRVLAGGQDSARAGFRSFPEGAARLPSYVQPLGYGGFALLLAALVLVVGRILAHLKRQLAA